MTNDIFQRWAVGVREAHSTRMQMNYKCLNDARDRSTLYKLAMNT